MTSFTGHEILMPNLTYHTYKNAICRPTLGLLLFMEIFISHLTCLTYRNATYLISGHGIITVNIYLSSLYIRHVPHLLVMEVWIPKFSCHTYKYAMYLITGYGINSLVILMPDLPSKTDNNTMYLIISLT